MPFDFLYALMAKKRRWAELRGTPLPRRFPVLLASALGLNL